MENKSFFKRYGFDLLAVGFFLLITFTYFSPLLEGKKIQQSDIIQVTGIQKEVNDYHKQTGEYALWTNSLFGGMPAYQIWLDYPTNFTGYVISFFTRLFPNPSGYILLYLLGFFLLLRTCRFNVWLSALGAIAFAFSSYHFIILEAGHTNKALTIGLFAPVMAGIILAYRGKYVPGASLTALMLAVQIRANHVQMTYYFSLAVLIYIIIRAVYAIKGKETGKFIRSSAALLVAAALAIGVNISNLWLTYEYGEETIRGKSELTLNPKANQGGLDKDYAYQYSYGVTESFTLLVPDFYGGASTGDLGKNSETFDALKNNGVPNAAQIVKQFPTYWGDQPFTSGPVYFGAIMMFLFVLGLFLVKGEIKWWALITFMLALMLSWGRHFEAFSNLFFDYFPMYNKFRAVSSILVIAGFAVPFLGMFLLKDLLEGKLEKQQVMKGLKNALMVVGGLLLIFILMPGMFGSFISENDKQVLGNAYDSLIDAVVADRKGLLRADAFRSLVFVLLTAGAVYLFITKKLKLNYALLGIGFLILADMWAVNKRYLNDENFGRKTATLPRFTPTNADLQILQDKDPNYRVVDFTTNPFTDSRTSYFHKNIGGYHAAKLKRYQEIIENHLSKNNMVVYSMLNTKYFIVQPQGMQEPMAQLNPDACGNVWFAKEIRYVANADSEMLALNNFDPKTTVIVDQRFKDKLTGLNPATDSTAAIKLLTYSPNELAYESNSVSEQFAVFSEIYYPKGWNVFIDGQPSEYIRVNYLLRGMKIPAGKHQIEFKFEPKGYAVGNKIALASSVLLVLGLAASLYLGRKEW